MCLYREPGVAYNSYLVALFFFFFLKIFHGLFRISLGEMFGYIV